MTQPVLLSWQGRLVAAGNVDSFQALVYKNHFFNIGCAWVHGLFIALYGVQRH